MRSNQVPAEPEIQKQVKEQDFMKGFNRRTKKISTALALVLGTFINGANGEDGPNASNPLASVTNLDLRAQYFDLDGPERRDYYLDGAKMLTPELKFKYELHYWDTDVTGSSERDWESIHLKPIYLPQNMVGAMGEWKYKVAFGAELIVDFGNDDKGIGSGSDQISAFTGIALAQGHTVLIPLVQQYKEYSGPDVNTTAFRLIGLQSFPDSHMWAKLDAKAPVDWENDNEIPASIELQIGKNFSPGFAAYAEGLAGVGGDRSYDWGAGLGLRFNY
jgi:hypothetical protein